MPELVALACSVPLPCAVGKARWGRAAVDATGGGAAGFCVALAEAAGWLGVVGDGVFVLGVRGESEAIALFARSDAPGIGVPEAA